MAPLAPLVSIIIPTRDRIPLLKRALHTAITQTHTSIEIIVVVDGDKRERYAWLSEIHDDRLRAVFLDSPGGGGRARNAGLDLAKGSWIAFLDDDDEWVPQKLETQLSRARACNSTYPIVACRAVLQVDGKKYVIPSRLPEPEEDPLDYVFLRKSLFFTEAQFQTSMFIAPRPLFERARFGELPRHQEWDFLIRAVRTAGATLIYCPEVLTKWNIESNRNSISSSTKVGGAQFSFDWVHDHWKAGRLSNAQASSLLLTFVADFAVRSGDWGVLLKTVTSALRKIPGPVPLLVFLGIVLLPKRSRQWIRALLKRH